MTTWWLLGRTMPEVGSPMGSVFDEDESLAPGVALPPVTARVHEPPRPTSRLSAPALTPGSSNIQLDVGSMATTYTGGSRDSILETNQKYDYLKIKHDGPSRRSSSAEGSDDEFRKMMAYSQQLLGVSVSPVPHDALTLRGEDHVDDHYTQETGVFNAAYIGDDEQETPFYDPPATSRSVYSYDQPEAAGGPSAPIPKVSITTVPDRQRSDDEEDKDGEEDITPRIVPTRDRPNKSPHSLHRKPLRTIRRQKYPEGKKIPPLKDRIPHDIYDKPQTRKDPTRTPSRQRKGKQLPPLEKQERMLWLGSPAEVFYDKQFLFVTGSA